MDNTLPEFLEITQIKTEIKSEEYDDDDDDDDDEFNENILNSECIIDENIKDEPYGDEADISAFQELIWCEICYKTFPNTDELQNHMDVGNHEYEPQKFFMCTLCDKRFFDNGTVEAHLQIRSHFPLEAIAAKAFDYTDDIEYLRKRYIVTKYQCKNCPNTYQTPGNLARHELVHSNQYVCKFCNKAFSTNSSLRAHEKVHAVNQKSYRCRLCKTSFSNQAAFNVHRIYHKTPPYLCKLCSKDYQTWRSLKFHIKNAHCGPVSPKKDITPFPCEVCQKTFPTCARLKRHQHIHSDVRPYSCDICGRNFVHSTSLKAHRFSHTEERPFQCQICDKFFKGEKALRFHMKIHSELKPFDCSICHKAFVDNSTLKRHLRTTHFRQPQISECTVCHKIYLSLYRLKQHMLKHENSPILLAHKCDDCEKTFAQPYALKQHKLCHLTELNYECTICFKRFKNDRNLKRHQIWHSEAKPHVCKICHNASFRDRTQLKRHQMNNCSSIAQRKSRLDPNKPDSPVEIEKILNVTQMNMELSETYESHSENKGLSDAKETCSNNVMPSNSEMMLNASDESKIEGKLDTKQNGLDNIEFELRDRRQELTPFQSKQVEKSSKIESNPLGNNLEKEQLYNEKQSTPNNAIEAESDGETLASSDTDESQEYSSESEDDGSGASTEGKLVNTKQNGLDNSEFELRDRRLELSETSFKLKDELMRNSSD